VLATELDLPLDDLGVVVTVALLGVVGRGVYLATWAKLGFAWLWVSSLAAYLLQLLLVPVVEGMELAEAVSSATSSVLSCSERNSRMENLLLLQLGPLELGLPKPVHSRVVMVEPRATGPIPYCQPYCVVTEFVLIRECHVRNAIGGGLLV
jgi:hypothetical protein